MIGPILALSIIPIATIFLLRMDDMNKKRKLILNILLILNTLLWLLPFLVYLSGVIDGQSGSNSGTTAALYLYIVLIPICGVIHLTLLILKIMYRMGKPKEQV